MRPSAVPKLSCGRLQKTRGSSGPVLPASVRDPRNVPLDRFKPYLQAEFAAGNTVATELYQQIREKPMLWSKSAWPAQPSPTPAT
jgi:hypothetical protein